MSNLFIAIFAYLIDRKFGEFSFIKHPIIIIGELTSWFERHFYKDSVLRGILLLLFMLCITTTLSFVLVSILEQLPYPLYILLSSIIASIFIAHKMLRDAVRGVVFAKDKRAAISMLVSRDTENLSESDIYKAAIETYAENLSDGVIAPLLYLLLFGLPGIIFYKTVNTLDSMVGYRNKKYERYGKASARVDDILNFIPSRLTAILIMLLSKKKDILSFYDDGKKHDSPNAGHPITAMALALDVSLGGDTSYFGEIKSKPYFGKGRKEIKREDVLRALKLV